MDEKKDLAKKRFEIIKPFFSKEKKLKDIENDHNISYATLKRWVKSYKEYGLEGLIKRERNDKNVHKKLNNESLKIIKRLYLENSELSIKKLYELSLSILNSLNYEISYPTFYRIVNNLDDFVKTSSDRHIKKLSQKGIVYGIAQFPIYFPLGNDKIFYIILLFDTIDFKIINFLFEKKEFTFKELFPFIRESILLGNSYPKKIILTNTVKEKSKKTIRVSFLETGIDFIDDEDYDLSPIKKQFNFLEIELIKTFFNQEKKFDIQDIYTFISSYFSLGDYNSCNQISSNLVFMRKLDFFLLKYNRKVYSYGIRLKSHIYDNPILRDIVEEIVEIKYSPLNQNIIYIFYKNSFLCEGFLIQN